MAAYPLSRRDFYGRKMIMGLFVFTMLFSGGLIPFFLVVRGLGLYNTRLALLIPGAMSVWNMILTRTYFMANIPDELYEASVIDGCSDVRFIIRVVIPLSGPILAVIGLFYAVGHWNSYFGALIFLKNKNLFPLQIFLRNILLLNQVDFERLKDIDEMIMKQDLVDLLKYALIIVASVPVLLVYPFVQKFFIRGVLLGSIKG
jgi:ABC-type glycerol-3-phosphate transport system permease component